MAKNERNIWGPKMVQLVTSVRLLTRPNGATAQELADELELSRRTVYRILETIEVLIGGPLDKIDGILQNEKRYKFPTGFTLSLPLTRLSGLTVPELMALFALKMNTGLFRGSVISDDIESAFAKISNALSPETKSVLERYSNLFISVPKTPKDYASHDETIEELSMAILGRKTCRINYTTFSEKEIREKTYDINPLHFFERDGGLYVFVQVSSFQDIRLLAVERIKQIEMTEKSFAWPDNFSPEDLLSSAFGLYWDDPITVKIRFPANQARYIRERNWAEKQCIETEEGGSIVLTLVTSGRYDIKRWVMSYGRSAELIEPISLRDEIKKELAEALQSYT